MFKTAPEPGLNGRAIAYPRGRVIGGSSAINAMIYMRGQAADYDGWRQLGLAGWGWDDVLPYFIRHEDHHGGADALHGAGGEWRVERPRISWPILDAVREAGGRDRHPEDRRLQSRRQRRLGLFRGQPAPRPALERGARLSEADPQAAEPASCDRRACRAHCSSRAGARSACAMRQTASSREARASGEIVLAAGAIGSPQLLELSGVGAAGASPGDRRAGRPRAAGRRRKPAGPSAVAGRSSASKARARSMSITQSLFKRAMMGLDYALRRRGPMTMAPSQLGMFARSSPDYATANIEFHVQPLSLDRFGEPLHAFPAITISVCNLRPDEPRLEPRRKRRSARRADDPAELSVDAGRPARRGGLDPPCAPPRRRASARAIRAARAPARPASCRRR